MSYSVLHTFAVNDAATQVVITDATLTASSRVGGWTGAPVDTAQTFTITPPNGAAVAVDVTSAFPNSTGATFTITSSNASGLYTNGVLPDGVYTVAASYTVDASNGNAAGTYTFFGAFVVHAELTCCISSLLVSLANDCIDCSDDTKDDLFCKIQAAKVYLEGAIVSAAIVNATDYACAASLFSKANAACGTSESSNCCN